MSVLHNDRRAIPKSELTEMPVFRSLTLVSPTDPEFYVRETDRGTLQPRTTFDFDGHEYDFPITDPRWRQQARAEGIGSLPSAEIVGDNEEIIFTISLGEADKNNMCYKIVAAVFSIDSTQLIEP